MRDLLAEFDEFDSRNPIVWEYFERFAQQAIARGRTRSSVSLIIERIRWEIWLMTDSIDEFKINNNHRAYYARKWLKAHPDHPKFFELRRVRCGSWPPPPDWDHWSDEFDFE